MGKEWLNWGGSVKSGMRRRSGEEDRVAEEVESPGCMCAVFQMFNVHYFPFALRHRRHHQQPQTQPQTPRSFRTSTNVVLFHDKPPHVQKGVEAPRNSLDLEESFMEATSSSSTQILDEYLNIQVGIQIKTCEDFSLPICINNSPSTKTPNLVARLMGLELLPPPPQTTSPSLSSTIFNSPTSKRIIRDCCSGTFSLPETPRISSCSRRSDVDHHRLSLQLHHKENFLEEELMELSSLITHERYGINKEKSKGQILKQVKESVRRRFGLDITNTTIKSKEQRKDINVLVENDLIQPKKPSSRQSSKENKQFGKSKVKEVVHEVHQEKKLVVLETSRRVRKPPQASDDSVRSKKEDPFVHSIVTNKGNIIAFDKKVKKTPMSSDHLVNQVQKQVFHDSPSKKRSKQFSSHLPLTFQNFQENIQDSKQNHYIQTILKHTGIEKNKLYSTTSYPPVLNLSLCHFLEVFDHNTPDPICQRKLIFDLVDELLAEIFKPFAKKHNLIKGFDLVEILCKKVGSFPLANCQVIEDIDALVYEDFRRGKMGKWDAFEEGEGECMVMDIEDYIVDLLVQETVAIVALMDVDLVTHCVRRVY